LSGLCSGRLSVLGCGGCFVCVETRRGGDSLGERAGGELGSRRIGRPDGRPIGA